MTSGRGFGRRMDLIKADTVTADICRICKDTPSQYVRGRAMVAKAGILTRSDLKKAVRILRKARREFQREAEVAGAYNRVRERVRISGDPALERLEGRYTDLICRGEYGKAAKDVRRMGRMTAGLGHPIEASMSVRDGARAIRVSNQSGRTVIVVLMVARADNREVVLTPASFALQPFGTKTVACSGEGRASLDLRIDYRDGDTDRTVSTVLTPAGASA